MSESDAQTSIGTIAAAVSAAQDNNVQSNDTASLFATQLPPSPDDWSNWSMAGADVQPLAGGVDLVSDNGGTDDWFPSVNAAAVLALTPDVDPLVSIPSIDLATGGIAGLDGSMDYAATAVAYVIPTTEAANALHALTVPADHGMPLDHIEWHFTGLIPLV